jgi:PAS domain S-box-containing protein
MTRLRPPTLRPAANGLRRLLRYRMVLAVLVPVLGLIAFSAYVVHEKLQSYRDSADLLQAAQFARTAHALARELENERSLAALYIGTDRLAWRSELEDQRQQTDERVATFRALMSQAKIRALVGRPNLDLGLGTVDALRAGTDGDDDLRKMLDGYGSVISTLINTSSKLSRADLSNLIAAYMDLGNIKDRIARMRSIGASWLLRGGADRELVALFAEAHAEKKAFLQSFRGHASTEQLQLFDDIVRGPILDEVARLDALALSGRLTKADTRTWDRTHTALVDLIVRAEEKLASEMERHIQANLRSAQITFYLVVLGVVALVAFSLEALRRSERRAVIWEEEARKLFRAVEQSPVSVMITDPAGLIEYINPAFTRMSGYGRDEVLGRNPRILRSKQTTNATYAEMWRTIEGGAEWRGEIVNRRKDGTDYWEKMTIAPVKGGDGEVDNYIALKEDITEVRDLRQALEREHANIRRILDATHDGIALVDGSARFEYFNPALEAEFGPIAGRDATDYFQTPLPSPSEYINRREWRSSGTGKTYEVTASPVHKPDGQISVLLVLHDITLRKQAEDAMLEAREAAELANRSKSEFLATMSHELRTPLNAIIGFSEIMEHELLGPAGQPQYVDYSRDINESGRHLLQLINDILDVARLEVGRVTLREDYVGVHAIIGACLSMVRERAGTGGVAVIDRVSPDLPELYADERRLKQILVNVIGNAIKFTQSGGRVILDAFVDADGLAITVADTGIGIASDDIAKVMAPFGQADSSLARRYEGSGLGLPLSRKLMDMHDGKLLLASRLGTGTTVTLRFPKERVRAAQPVA